MNWNYITDLSQIETIDSESNQQLILIFKHSTRCNISSTALSRLERNWKITDWEKIKPYYLDLLQHRDISEFIEQHYLIEHQSPQALLIKNGKCSYSITHLDINYNELLSKSH